MAQAEGYGALQRLATGDALIPVLSQGLAGIMVGIVDASGASEKLLERSLERGLDLRPEGCAK